jgi:hypothetical protein
MYLITGTTSTGENGTGTAGNPNVLIDRYVIYNHLERTWYYGTWNGTTVRPRTAWLDSPLRSEPMAAIGYTSSRVYAYTNGALVYHETTVDNNETSTPIAIDAYVQSSDFDIGDGHNFGFVWRLIPDITFDGSSSAAPTAYFTVRPRQNPGANYGTSNNPSVDKRTVLRKHNDIQRPAIYSAEYLCGYAGVRWRLRFHHQTLVRSGS